MNKWKTLFLKRGGSVNSTGLPITFLILVARHGTRGKWQQNGSQPKYNLCYITAICSS